MKYSFFVAFAVLPFLESYAASDSDSAAAVWVPGIPFSCGNEFLVEDPTILAARARFGANAVNFSAAAASIVVQLYIHLVASRFNTELITQIQVDQQVAMLNLRFRPSGISFNLVNISRTVEDNWARNTVRAAKSSEFT
jgi:hypothetical protein